MASGYKTKSKKKSCHTGDDNYSFGSFSVCLPNWERASD